MKFSTGLPGLNRYPPITCEWEASMHAGDFQRIARTADELKFDSLGRAPVLRGKQATIDAIAELQEIGVTWTSIPPPPTRSLTEYLESLQWAAEEIMPAFR